MGKKRETLCLVCTHMQPFEAADGMRYVCCLYGKRIIEEPEACEGYDEAKRPANFHAQRSLDDFKERVQEVMDDGAGPMTTAYAIRALADEYGVPRGRVKRYAGSKASCLLYLCMLPKETQDAVATGKVPYSVARILLAVKDPDVHHEVLQQAIKEHLSWEKTRRLVNEKIKELKNNGK